MVVTLTVTASAVLVFFIDEVRDSIEDRYTLVFHTSTTQALRPRAPVWLAGQPVGYVRTLTLEDPSTNRGELLHIELSLSADMSRFVTEGAAAQVISSSLLGEPIVNIIPARESGPELTEGSDLPAIPELDPFQVSRNLQVIYDSVVPVAERWREVFKVAESGEGTLSHLFRGGEDVDAALGYFQELTAVFDTIRMAAEKFSGLLSDESTRAALARIGPRVAQLKEQWSCGACSLSRLASDSVLAPRFRTMAQTIGQIQERLDTGQGSAGRLLHDRILAEEMEETRQMLRELRAELAELGTGATQR